MEFLKNPKNMKTDGGPEEEWVNPQTTKARFVRYAMIQSLQRFSELTHFSSEVSIYSINLSLSKFLELKTFKRLIFPEPKTHNLYVYRNVDGDFYLEIQRNL